MRRPRRFVSVTPRWMASICCWHCSTKAKAWSDPCLPARGRIRTGYAKTWRRSWAAPAFSVRARRPVRCSSPSGSPA